MSKELGKMMIKLRKNGIDKMKSLLDQVQSYLRECENDTHMDEYQIPLIPTTQTFIQYGKEVDGGLSPISGLIKYCHNAINVVKSGVEKNACNVPIVIHIGEKMAHVSLSLRYVVDIKTLSQDEIVQLENCEESARSWLDNKERESLLKDVENRVSMVKRNLADGGVLHVLKNRGDALGPLLNWA